MKEPFEKGLPQPVIVVECQQNGARYDYQEQQKQPQWHSQHRGTSCHFHLTDGTAKRQVIGNDTCLVNQGNGAPWSAHFTIVGVGGHIFIPEGYASLCRRQRANIGARTGIRQKGKIAGTCSQAFVLTRACKP